MTSTRADSLDDRVLRLVILGPPGGGKGTQAKMLHVRYAIPHISTGDIYRVEMALGTERGMEAKQYLADGSLCPDDLTNAIVTDRLARPDCDRGYILDGYPRTLEQAKYLETIGEVTVAIELVVSLDGCKKRLLARGRKDDQPEIITHRFEIYEREVAPMREFYRDEGKLLTIDGNGAVEEIIVRIWDAIDEFTSS